MTPERALALYRNQRLIGVLRELPGPVYGPVEGLAVLHHSRWSGRVLGLEVLDHLQDEDGEALAARLRPLGIEVVLTPVSALTSWLQ